MASKADKQINDLALGAVLAAKKQEKVAEMMGDMVLVSQVLESAQVKNALSNPAVTLENRYEALKKTFEGQVEGITLSALGMLMERGLVGSFKVFREAVEDAAKEHAAFFVCHVASAVPLTDMNKKQLKDALEKKFKGKVDLVCEIDTALIGGLSITCGDWRYMGTVQAKLQQLSRHLVTMQ